MQAVFTNMIAGTKNKTIGLKQLTLQAQYTEPSDLFTLELGVDYHAECVVGEIVRNLVVKKIYTYFIYFFCRVIL